MAWRTASGARPSATMARVAGRAGPIARSAARTLGTIPPPMTPSAMRRSASVGVERRGCAGRPLPDAVRVGQEEQLAPERGRQGGRGVVRVDVADASRPRRGRSGATTGRRPRARSVGEQSRLGDRLIDDAAQAGQPARRGSIPPSMPAQPDRVGAEARAGPRRSSALMTPPRTARATSSAASSVTRRPPSKRLSTPRRASHSVSRLPPPWTTTIGRLAGSSATISAGRPAPRRSSCRRA